MIEAETYRHGGPLARRPGQVPARRRGGRSGCAKDPIPRYRARLVEAGAERGAARPRSSTRCAAEVERATEEAKAGAVPGEDLLMKDVWADGGSAWRN